MGVCGLCHAPATLPLGKTWYPLYRRLGGPQDRSGWVWKISPSPGFDSRTVQPVASCYTDWCWFIPYLWNSCFLITHLLTKTGITNIWTNLQLTTFTVFQTPYYWPWQHRSPDNIEYAIYLVKRTLRNKQRHGLEEYEMVTLLNSYP